jgi:hypothetical protein
MDNARQNSAKLAASMAPAAAGSSHGSPAQGSPNSRMALAKPASPSAPKVASSRRLLSTWF